MVGERQQQLHASLQIRRTSSMDSEQELEDESLIADASLAARKARDSLPELQQWCSARRLILAVMRSLMVVILKSKISLLMPLGPAAMLVHKYNGHQGVVFFLSFFGIIPLAGRLSFVTEQLALFTGTAVGGLLNATFGNATEMIISIHALKAGKVRVVQQSLLGSILSNMLLVLGGAFFVGGVVVYDRPQVFNKTAAGMNSGLLLMSVLALLVPTVLHYTHTEMHSGASELDLSRFSSCVMLLSYASHLFFQLKNSNLQEPVSDEEENMEEGPSEDEVPEISKREAILWLAIFTIWISALSEFLVNAIGGASISMKLPLAFISVILLPFVGNVVEHYGAITFARKDKLDLSLGVAIGSSTQIAMFVIPFCVLVGWSLGCPMDLNFHLFETATILITVIVVAFMLQEGTANYFKGLMLIFCYFIVAAGFFSHIDPTSEQIP